MTAIESFHIHPVEVITTGGGVGLVRNNLIKTKEDEEYYQVHRRETRYRISRPTGGLLLPYLIYDTPTRNECYFASGVIHQTRNYIRELDKTYFKFFDDAEEVRNNIIFFIKWLHTVPKIGLKAVDKKKILAIYGHLLLDVPPTQEWERILSLTFDAKKRSDLGPLARDLQDELDLIPASR